MAHIGGAAANHFGTLGTGHRSALTGFFEILHGGLAGFANAIAPMLAAHEDGRAHVFAPLKTIIAFTPAEHAISGA